MTLIHTLAAFVLALGLLVFFHELGHYLAARWAGVKVLKFSVGFGKPLLKWTTGPDKTEWCISAIPLGGYVKMLNEQGGDEVLPEDRHREFGRQSVFKRSVIVLAGPVANFLLAIVLYAAVGWAGLTEPAAILEPVEQSAAQAAGLQPGDKVIALDGKSISNWNELRIRMLDAVVDKRVVKLDLESATRVKTISIDTGKLPAGEVERDFMRSLGLELASGRVLLGATAEGGSAKLAGLQSGDHVVSVDGVPIRRAKVLIDAIRQKAAQPMRFEIDRMVDGKLQTQQIVVTPNPTQIEEAGKPISVGRIGAAVTQEVAKVTVQHGIFDGLVYGAKQTWDMSIFSLRMLVKMFTGDLSWKNLSGPVTIADYAGQTARIGWQAYLGFLALISVSLGVLNLLPVPVLDGGHLVYYAAEAVRGRPVSERTMALTQRIGMGLISAMMVVALFNDIVRVFSPG
jgi:regulator of sigma E protease